MRIGIVGAGAMGGLLGAGMASSGLEVTLMDTGEHLAAIQRNGLRLIAPDGTETRVQNTRAVARFEEAGPQDVVFLSLKAHQVRDVAGKMAALYTTDTTVVTLQNGIPWWYFQKHGGPYEGRRILALDPDGIIETGIPFPRILGGVAYASGEILEPGVVRHMEGRRFPVGEPDGSESARVRCVVELLSHAGFKSYILKDIRSEIWLKALGNLCFNPLSALTQATLVDICRFPETRALAARMMEEARTAAEKMGIRFRRTIEDRIAGAERVGAHRTSMLQDAAAGRPLETQALLGAVLEITRLTGTPAPVLAAVYACTRLLERTYTRSGARIELTPVESIGGGN